MPPAAVGVIHWCGVPSLIQGMLAQERMSLEGLRWMLPTGEAVTTLDVPGVGRIACSMVDAANACVFVRAADVGLTGTEMPEALEQNLAVMKKLGMTPAAPFTFSHPHLAADHPLATHVLYAIS